jgi:hypothetical protein
MDNALVQKVQEYFNRTDIKKNLTDFLANFIPEELQKKFNYVWGAVQKGDFDIDDLEDYLADWLGLDEDLAAEIDDEFFNLVYGDIYFDLKKIYEQRQNDEEEEGVTETSLIPEEEFAAPNTSNITRIEPEQISVSTAAPLDLAGMYQQFSKSSLFSNALEAEKAIKMQGGGDSAKLKNIFYEAINAADVVKVVGALRVIFGSGVKKFFTGDSRYTDFMGKYLNRNQKLEIGNQEPASSAGEQFNNNPTDKKYIISFIRLIIEKKLHLSETQSAMIGVSLGSLARSGGEEEFGDVAYGEEEANKFLWNQ